MVCQLLYAARCELRACVVYAAFLSVSAASITPLGVLFLLHQHPETTKLVVGIFFFLFALAKLLGSTYDLGQSRSQGYAPVDGQVGSSSLAPAPVVLDPTGTTLIGPEGGYHWSCLHSCLKDSPALHGWMEYLLPPISESRLAVETVVLSLLCCGAASGFMGAVVGTISPPQLVTFALLDLTKGSMRGVKVLAMIVPGILRLTYVMRRSCS